MYSYKVIWKGSDSGDFKFLKFESQSDPNDGNEGTDVLFSGLSSLGSKSTFDFYAHDEHGNIIMLTKVIVEGNSHTYTKIMGSNKMDLCECTFNNDMMEFCVFIEEVADVKVDKESNKKVKDVSKKSNKKVKSVEDDVVVDKKPSKKSNRKVKSVEVTEDAKVDKKFIKKIKVQGKNKAEKTKKQKK